MKKVSVLEVSSIRNQSVEFFTGTKKYVATGDVDEKVIETFTEITYDNRPSRANIEVKSGQVLFARMKGTNKVIQIDELNQNYIYSTGFCVLEPSELVTTDYLRIFLKSDFFQVQKDKHSKGATQKAINNEGISKIKIPLTPLETQKKIVEALDKAQALIDARKEQIRLMDELVKSRFVEMFGDQYTNPNKYLVVPFNDVIEYMGDIGSNGANAVVSAHLDMKQDPDYALMVRFLNFTANDFVKNVKYVSEETYTFFKKSQVFGGELVFCKIGSAGLNYIMPHLNRPVSLGLNQIMVRTKENINMTYLHTLLNTNYGKHLIEGCINGAVTKSITKGALKKVPIMLPPINLQNQFAQYVQEIDTNKLKMQTSLNELTTTQQALMQQYFG